MTTDRLLQEAAGTISRAFRELLATGKDPNESLLLVQALDGGEVRATLHVAATFADAAEKDGGNALADWVRQPCPRDHFRVVTNAGRKWLPYHLPAKWNVQRGNDPTPS